MFGFHTLSFKKKSAILVGLLVLGLLFSVLSFQNFKSNENEAREKLVLFEKNKIAIEAIISDVLQARRAEKDFILRKDEKYLKKHDVIIEKLRADIRTLENETQNKNVLSLLESIKTKLNSYKAGFNGVASKIVKLGLNEKIGLEGELRKAIHNVEETLKKQNYRLKINMLSLRRHEKDFILRSDEKYVLKFENQMKEMNKALKVSSLDNNTKSDIKFSLTQYSEKFLRYSDIYLKLNDDINDFRKDVHVIEDLEIEISKLINQEKDKFTTKYELESDLQENIFLITLCLIFLLLILFIYNTMNKTAVSLARIDEDIRKVKETGKFDNKIHIDQAGEEIAMVAKNFNELLNTWESSIAEINDVMNSVSDGKFDTKVTQDLVGDFLALKNSINATANNMEIITSEIDFVMKNVASSVYDKRITSDFLGKYSSIKNNINIAINANANDFWIKDKLALLSTEISGIRDVRELSNKICEILADTVRSDLSVLYLYNEDEGNLKLSGNFSYMESSGLKQEMKIEEGLIGQVARELRPILMNNLEEGERKIKTSLVTISLKSTYTIPLSYEQELFGVMEFASQYNFSELELELLKKSQEIITISLKMAIQTNETEKLLKETQEIASELEAQQEELRLTNAELEEQTVNLQESEERLKENNIDLIEKSKELQEQKKNLEIIRENLENKTIELTQLSKYKSEFLANMSHELRTPLNSILILSNNLKKNITSNLNDKQIKHAQIINESGTELLSLINGVLDLSKIEAGKKDPYYEIVELEEFSKYLKKHFSHIVKDKGLTFNVKTNKDVPASILIDLSMLKQIISNLISNAVKFTEKGSVNIIINKNKAKDSICFAVEDTGIGIPEDKISNIFNAFEQVDGSLNRKYSGTGLGLSICNKFAHLMHGEIRVESKEDSGSVFTFIFPLEKNINKDNVINISEKHQIRQEANQEVLIIEDDKNFNDLLCEIATNHSLVGKGCYSANEAKDYLSQKIPRAIILDINLPDTNGDLLLDEIKRDEDLEKVPVHIITGSGSYIELLKKGCSTFLKKPIEEVNLSKIFNLIESSKSLDLCIIDDDKKITKKVINSFNGQNINIKTVDLVQAAIDDISSHNTNCVIMATSSDNLNTKELGELATKAKTESVPFLIYSGNESNISDEVIKLADSFIVDNANSQKRIFSDVNLFLFNLDNFETFNIENRDSEIFKDKNVLIVDDDERNIFSLRTVLDDLGPNIDTAENGQVAIEKIKENNFDIILMDIMMPVMNGIEAIEYIRNDLKLEKLPVIAVTAKAMEEDKVKCLEAGASDYISKPIDIERLLDIMKVWLVKDGE